MKILVLGATGMLGSTLFRVFRSSTDFETVGTIRNPSMLRFFSEADRATLITGTNVMDDKELFELLSSHQPDVVINCIGLIKQFAAANDPLAAVPINSLLPHRLAKMCQTMRTRLVHISTDCVFSGKGGNYTEDDVSDAEDLYGRSKAIGELLDYDSAVTLRTSIIGRELTTNHSLLDWFLSQSGSVAGYKKAIFSGLPTVELATVVRDFVLPRTDLRGLYHVSADPISKYDLLRLIGEQYGSGTEIISDSRVKIDRSLNSNRFRSVTGYIPPDWPKLIRRMYQDDPRREK